MTKKKEKDSKKIAKKLRGLQIINGAITEIKTKPHES